MCVNIIPLQGIRAKLMCFNAFTVKGRLPPQYAFPCILLWFYLMVAETDG